MGHTAGCTGLIQDINYNRIRDSWLPSIERWDSGLNKLPSLYQRSTQALANTRDMYS